MSVKSFLSCYCKLKQRVEKRYNVRCGLCKNFDLPNTVYLAEISSNEPSKGNATKALRFVLHLAKKHKVNVSLTACSRHDNITPYYGTINYNLKE